MVRDEPEWVFQRKPASDADEDLLAFFGHAPPVDPERLRANIDRKRRYWRHQESASTARARDTARGVVDNVKRAGHKLQETHGFADPDWLRQLTPASSNRSDLLGFFGVTPTSDLTLLYANIKRKRIYWLDRAGEVSTEMLDRIDEAATLLADALPRSPQHEQPEQPQPPPRRPPQHEQPKQPQPPPRRPPDHERERRRSRLPVAFLVFMASFVVLRLAVTFVARSPGARVPPVSAIVLIAALIALQASVVGVARRVVNGVVWAVALYVLVWGASVVVSRVLDIAVPAGEIRLLLAIALGVTLRYHKDRTLLQQVVVLVLVPTIAYLGAWAAAATLSRFPVIGMLPHVALVAVVVVVLLAGAAAVDREVGYGVVLMLVTTTAAWFLVGVIASVFGDTRGTPTVTPVARLLIALAIAAVVATEIGRTSQQPEA